MFMDYKDRIRMSINKFAKKNLPKKRSNKKRKRPEKEVEREVKDWCEEFGWDVTVIDSGFHEGERSKVGEYGFSDLAGNTPEGLSCYIELKAKGKISTLSIQQYLFLRRKIEKNCFAVVVDSAQLLGNLYRAFLVSTDKKAYLISRLPEKFNKDYDKPLFE